jgi:hypothetical protein
VVIIDQIVIDQGLGILENIDVSLNRDEHETS